jgi:hypothetical protein
MQTIEKIIQIIPAQPGTCAIYKDEATGKKDKDPVQIWALVETKDKIQCIVGFDAVGIQENECCEDAQNFSGYELRPTK